EGASAMQITATGFDLAKNVLQVHGIVPEGKAVVRRALRRKEVLGFFRKDSCLAGIEAPGPDEGTGRAKFDVSGATKGRCRLSGKPDVKRDKNDRADAAAIREAATRPDMRFVRGSVLKVQQNRPRRRSWHAGDV
ncbi:MAG: IS110 family transposase, partial [Methylocella sp.]